MPNVPPVDQLFYLHYGTGKKTDERKTVEARRKKLSDYLSKISEPQIEEIENLPGGIVYFPLDDLVSLIEKSVSGRKEKLNFYRDLKEKAADTTFPGYVARKSFCRLLEEYSFYEVFTYCEERLE